MLRPGITAALPESGLGARGWLMRGVMERVVVVRCCWSGGGSAAVRCGCWPPSETTFLPGMVAGWLRVAWGPKRLMRAAVREVPLTADPAVAAAPCMAVAAGRVAAGALRGRWAAGKRRAAAAAATAASRFLVAAAAAAVAVAVFAG